MSLHPIVAQLELTPVQQEAIEQDGVDVILTAGAGTGKTRTLVGRFLHLLAESDAEESLRQIVAVTFTHKAADEMRQRIRQEIEQYVIGLQDNSPERWSHYLLEIDNARIGTIHYLCGEIIRQHPAEAGVDPEFTTIDRDEMALLQAQVIHEIVGEMAQDSTFDLLFETLQVRGVRSLAETILYRRLDVAEIIDQPNNWLTQWRTYLENDSRKQLKQLLSQLKYRESVEHLINIEPLDASDRIVIVRNRVLMLLSTIEDKQSSIAARFEAANEIVETILVLANFVAKR